MSSVKKIQQEILNIGGWLSYLTVLGILALMLPAAYLDSSSHQFIFIIGAIGIWRYSMGIIHFIRGMIFLNWVFPKLRKQADVLGKEQPPSHIYLMVTSFRIDAQTTAMVYRSVIEEAMLSDGPVTIVASIVEVSDELLVKGLWEQYTPSNNVTLRFVRIPGTGKRDGLAHGFRAISRDMPDEHAVVAVVDGDTVLNKGVIEQCVPFFRLMPKMGALTTNEYCEVRGSYLMSEWHKLRFAQRHINMSSMSLSRRVLTLTGRMSLFRADIVTNPAFISDVESDNLKHWRLGRFKFLTGDDKSSWFSLMRLGYDTFYVPDASINTVEHPPSNSFVRSSLQLMFRWYGNSLRQNSRATKLGARKLGLFTYYVLFDQRISMWTSLLGLSAAILLSIHYGIFILLAYLLWIGITRLFITLLLKFSGHDIGPMYPLVLYYNQIIGAMVKIYVYFRLDRQSWTRQKTKLKASNTSFEAVFRRWSSRAVTFSSVSVFVAILMMLTQK